MKRFFTISAFILLAPVTTVLLAQNCDIANTRVRVNYLNVDANGSCFVNTDLYVDLKSNAGSKYVIMHIWPTSLYPNLLYANPPLAADLGSAFTIVTHHFQDHSNSHIDSVYKPDENVYPENREMHLEIAPGDEGYERFIIRNVNLEAAEACDVPQFFVLDIWSTGSESMNAVHCMARQIIFSGKPDEAVLPVRLKFFDATKQGPTVVLNWATAVEILSKGFGIERRVGDRPWEQIGFVNSSAVRGYSNSEINYLFVDYINSKEFIQYRLKLTDINGNHDYSDIRIVKGDKGGAITIFPNPSTGNVNIAFADVRWPYAVRVYDEGGRLINKWEDSKATLTIANLRPGVYIFKIDDKQNKRTTTHKVIVLNKK